MNTLVHFKYYFNQDIQVVHVFVALHFVSEIAEINTTARMFPVMGRQLEAAIITKHIEPPAPRVT
jgi:hypothetical protein